MAALKPPAITVNVIRAARPRLIRPRPGPGG
jgi:hypothetical protein